MVLFPALCAMGLTQFDKEGKLQISELGKFLTAEYPSNLIGYAGLEEQDPNVLQMTEWLKNDGPQNASDGFSYVKDKEAESPMDEPKTARFFTMALAGRARYLSPVVAAKITRREGRLLDIAGGTGYYTHEWLLANPTSHAVIFDRPEVLKVAAELLNEFCGQRGDEIKTLKDRVIFMPGDMLSDDLPKADIVLAASVFHDWPSETCQTLTSKFGSSFKPRR